MTYGANFPPGMKRQEAMRESRPMAGGALARLDAHVGITVEGASFSNEDNDGVLIARVRDSFLEGRFFEKVVSEETVRDPFGNESTEGVPAVVAGW